MNLKLPTYFCLLVFFIVCSTAFAQSKIDSLNTAIEREHNIESKASLYMDLSLEHKSTDLNRSEIFARQALVLAKKTDNKKLIGLLRAQLGDIAVLQDSLPKAEREYLAAIPLLIESEEFHRLILVYLSMGNRFIEKGDYTVAMGYYLKGMELSEDTDDPTYLPRLYNNLGIVYINTNKHKKALDYYSKALTLFEELQDTINIAGTTSNIGSIYIELEEYDIARQYYLKAYKIFKDISLIGGEAHVLFKLGLLDKMQQQYDEALQNLFESKRLLESESDGKSGSKSIFLAEINIHIGMGYFFLQQYSQAEEFLNIGFEVSWEQGQSSLIALASNYLSKVYKQNGDYKKALDQFILFKAYTDSSFNEDNVRKMTQLEMQYRFDMETKDSEIHRIAENQKRDGLIFIAIVISIGLFLILLIVALLLKLEKKKKLKVELEREFLLEKLEHTNKELTTHVMYLLKKNEFILTIIEKLKKVRLDAKPENKKVMAELISELQSNTDTVSWEEFEVRFQQVHTDFYSKLSKQFPELSNNEIRLCAFFKLNMTSKEIAALTYQSLNSIKVARYRLRKKLQLNKEDNLVKFLAQF